MYPILFQLGPLTIHTYGVFYALGILTAVALSDFLYRRSGGRPGTLVEMALPVIIGVIAGARALFILVEHDYFFRNPLEIPMVWKGGLVFYGGLIGGTAVFVIAARARRLDVWRLADSVAPGVALGHALGRIGCFFAGSCYGRPTDAPWAVVFTDPRSLAGGILGVKVHPVQLYEAAFLFAFSAVLAFMVPRSGFKGQVVVAYAAGYPVFRFLLEFLRGDPRGTTTLLGLTLSTSQLISVLLFSASVVLYLHRRHGGRLDLGVQGSVWRGAVQSPGSAGQRKKR